MYDESFVLVHEFAIHSQDNGSLGFILWSRKSGWHKLEQEEKQGDQLCFITLFHHN